MLFILNVTLFLCLDFALLVMMLQSKQLPTRVDAEAGNLKRTDIHQNSCVSQ